jgi:hypothetical protein
VTGWKTWVGGCALVAALVAGPLVAAPRSGPVPSPVLGDWEGIGPRGLPFSFSLARVRGRITISDLTTDDPLYCSGSLEPTNAYAYPRATYIGPGALPVVRINWQPDEILIRVGRGAPFEPEWDGRLLGPRKATLSTPAPTNEPKGCGWSTKRLTWRLAPAKRVPVKPGVWTGAVTVPGGSGTVSVTFMPSGRIVQLFKVSVRCPSGGGSFSVGPAKVGDFIAADGSFEDANRPSSFHGRFAPGGSLTGKVTASLPKSCGASSFAFAAQPG